MAYKCDRYFMSQFAYIDGECIHTSIFNNDKHNKPKCINGHELVFCSGKRKRAYFRHNNPNDLNHEKPKSEWHCKWQGFFKDTEVVFKKTNDDQIKNRFSDVLLNDKYILEIQHSNISDSEVICRAQDYKLHDKQLLWVVDGNTSDVILNTLSDNSFLIEFKNNWKYESFCHEYEFILLDIDEKIFKIPVNKVCNKMFHAKEHKCITDVVNTLTNNPEQIWDLWKHDNSVKPTLTIKQEGAGNGKTFGIWKTVSLNFDKDLYIITTKQHTAKEVILNELNDQAERREFHIIDNMEELQDSIYNKQYIVSYKHRHSARVCLVIIGTVDSFIYSLTSKSIGGLPFFEGLLHNICMNGCDKVNSFTGEITYGGGKRKLNKMTELWIDETQDLPIDYYKAMVKLILETKIDCVIVGDKLQSLEHEKNFMTSIDGNTNIKLVREEPKNINRRIKVKHMAEKINQLVHFTKYDLPEITIENSEELDDRGEQVIEIFEQKTVYANDTDKKKIDNEVNKIIDLVNNEVEAFDYKPKDFLFIFPIMKHNILAGELETKLNHFWLEKMEHDDQYKQYAVLHKHQEGQVIDTSKSRDATRIMSIRSSKGDGRSVVFVLNCTEASLKMVSNNDKKLVYESHLHVALTRAKHKTYFGLIKNNDDIHKRFSQVDENIEYIPTIRTMFTIDTITQFIDKTKCLELLSNSNSNIHEKEEAKEEKEEASHVPPSKIIDWQYHCIRHAVYYNYALFEIFQKNVSNKIFNESPIKVVLDKISKLTVRSQSPNKFYTYINSLQDLDSMIFFPLCNLSHKPVYTKYFIVLTEIITNIQEKYRQNPLSIGDLTPMESCVLIYLIDVFENKKYHDITPTTIYNIIDSFEKNDDIEKLIEESKNIKLIMNNLMSSILESHEIKWNIEHTVIYKGKSDDLRLHKRFSILGHSEQKVYHLVFQTDFNKLNYNDTMVNLLLERFLIKSPKGNELEKNNETRYKNKKIITYLLILKQNKYEIFDWDLEDKVSNDFIILCKDALKTHFQTYNKELFNYCMHIKKNKSKWSTHPSPYLFIANKIELKNAVFAKDFFKSLHNDWNSGKDVKKITDNEHLFYEKMNTHIDDMCDAYFGVNMNTIDDEQEW
tara:strand:- start:2 stop:3355 length:3354 start_codon:yes stop_codon:yes gene_type:complete